MENFTGGNIDVVENTKAPEIDADEMVRRFELQIQAKDENRQAEIIDGLQKGEIKASSIFEGTDTKYFQAIVRNMERGYKRGEVAFIVKSYAIEKGVTWNDETHKVGLLEGDDSKLAIYIFDAEGQIKETITVYHGPDE